MPASIKEEKVTLPVAHEESEKRQIIACSTGNETTAALTSVSVKAEEESLPAASQDHEKAPDIPCPTAMADFKHTTSSSNIDEREDSSVHSLDPKKIRSINSLIARDCIVPCTSWATAPGRFRSATYSWPPSLRPNDCCCGTLKLNLFNIHQSKNGEMKDFHICSECKMKFTYKSFLKRHQETHRSQKIFACTECEKRFTTNAFLVVHQRIHTGQRPFPCTQCEKSFTAKSYLRQHQQTHAVVKPFHCTKCGKAFAQQKGLQRHQKTHGLRPFPCTECEKSFAEKSVLQQHQRTHSKVRPFSCTDCKKSFTEKSYLLLHQRIHTGVRPFHCTECDKSFTRKSNLRVHQKIHTGKRPFHCTECQKSFIYKTALLVHQRIHTRMRPFQCTECEKSFKHKSHLLQHQRNHTGVKPFHCNECEKTFTQKTQLMYHQRIHTGVRPYRCSECDKGFTQKCNLLQHQEIHTRTSPFHCSECGKIFTCKSNLRTHQRIHTGVSLHQCSECEKSFTQKSSLVTHQRIHTGVRPFRCTECEKSFTQKANLLQHKRIHTGLKPFQCTECEKRFTQKANLLYHQRKHRGVRPFHCTECEKSFPYKRNLLFHQRIHAGERPFHCTECEKRFTCKPHLVNHQRTHTLCLKLMKLQSPSQKETQGNHSGCCTLLSDKPKADRPRFPLKEHFGIATQALSTSEGTPGLFALIFTLLIPLGSDELDHCGWHATQIEEERTTVPVILPMKEEEEKQEVCPWEKGSQRKTSSNQAIMIGKTPAVSSNINEEAEACPIEHDDEDSEIKRSLNIITVMADINPTIIPNIKEEQKYCSVDGQETEMKGRTNNPVDNGVQFVSHRMKSFLSNLGIKHLTTALYRPQWNGMVERVNRMMKETIQFAFDAGGSVQEAVEDRIWCYYTPHSTTGVTPFALLRGRHLVNELSPVWVIEESDPDKNIPSLEYMKDKVGGSQAKAKSRYEEIKRVKDIVFNVGDRVRVRRTLKLKGSKYFQETKVVQVFMHSVRVEDGKWWSKRKVAIVGKGVDRVADMLIFQTHDKGFVDYESGVRDASDLQEGRMFYEPGVLDGEDVVVRIHTLTRAHCNLPMSTLLRTRLSDRNSVLLSRLEDASERWGTLDCCQRPPEARHVEGLCSENADSGGLWPGQHPLQEKVGGPEALDPEDHRGGKSEKRKSWRLSPWDMQDGEVARGLRLDTDLYFKENEGSVRSAVSLWEAYKTVLRDSAQNLVAQKRHRDNKQLDDIEAKLLEIERKATHTPTSPLLRQLELTKVEYKELAEKETKARLRATQCRLYETGDKAGKLLAWPGKKEREARWVQVIETQNGARATEDNDIAETFAGYSKEFYRARSMAEIDSITTYLNGIAMPVLDLVDREELVEDLTVEEISAALARLRPGKAPGPNGLPAEIFKSFREVLAPHLLNMYLEAREEGVLPPDLRRAEIAVIHKEGRPKDKCSSYRPISLLNVEVKALASVLASRMLRVISSLIHMDQIGFIPGRSTIHNLRRAHIWLAAVMNRPEPHLFLALDAEKSFDAVHWPFLVATLRRFGFGPNYIKWLPLSTLHLKKKRNNCVHLAVRIQRVKSSKSCDCVLHLFSMKEEENGKLCPLDDKDSQSKHCSIQEGPVIVSSTFSVKKDNKERLSPLDDQDSQSKSSSNQAIMVDTIPAVSSKIKEEAQACPVEHEDEDCEIKRSLNIITVTVDSMPAVSSDIKEEKKDWPIGHDYDDFEIKRSLNIITVMANTKPTIDPNIKEEQEDCSVDGQDPEMKGSTNNHILQQLATGKINKKESYTCSECKMNFTQKSILKKHLKIHRKQRLFPCTECEKRFFKKTDLVAHQRIHEGVRPFQCNECGKSFTHRATLFHHRKTHIGVRPFPCTECEKRFISKEALEMHQRIHSGLRPFPCTECGKSFTTQSYLRQHERRHTGVRSFHCSECEKSFARKSHLLNHQRTHTGARPFQCTECDKAFAQKSNLYQHQKLHTGKRPFPCTECEKGFISKASLLEHQRIHTGLKSFHCTKCDKSFTQRPNLLRHQRIHTGLRPYHCNVCGKSFNHRSTFVSHERIHLGVKLHQCTECEKSFTRKSTLVVHLRVHTGVKPFHCTDCEKTFSQKINLIQHQRIHTGARPFHCSECEKTFARKLNLVKHKMTHMAVKQFHCSEYEKNFTERSGLANHQKIHTG
ncbi:uncharacterized protein [Pleurodeles waltl]|uniref:uncharacterized protein n=1 Tax=Pleurodeles waltl TaxID=8319 RepID=UPI003709387C